MQKILRDIRGDRIQNQLDKRDKAQHLWPHHPDKLLLSDVVYPVRFYGSLGVAESKGDPAVKAAIQKLGFRRLAGAGSTDSKAPKIFLSIAAHKICLRQMKRKFETEWFPIESVSYCADDKAERRVVAVIVAKSADRVAAEQGTEEAALPFLCYVFESDKHADEIVRTVGQAFDLSYRKFMSDDSKEMQLKNQLSAMVAKIQSLEEYQSQCEDRISQLERCLASHNIPLPKSAVNFNRKSVVCEDWKPRVDGAVVPVPPLKPPPKANGPRREAVGSEYMTPSGGRVCASDDLVDLSADYVEPAAVSGEPSIDEFLQITRLPDTNGFSPENHAYSELGGLGNMPDVGRGVYDEPDMEEPPADLLAALDGLAFPAASENPFSQPSART